MTTCRLSLMSLAQVSSGCCSSSVLTGGQCPGDVSGHTPGGRAGSGGVASVGRVRRASLTVGRLYVPNSVWIFATLTRLSSPG